MERNSVEIALDYCLSRLYWNWNQIYTHLLFGQNKGDRVEKNESMTLWYCHAPPSWTTPYGKLFAKCQQCSLRRISCSTKCLLSFIMLQEYAARRNDYKGPMCLPIDVSMHGNGEKVIHAHRCFITSFALVRFLEVSLDPPQNFAQCLLRQYFLFLHALSPR